MTVTTWLLEADVLHLTGRQEADKKGCGGIIFPFSSDGFNGAPWNVLGQQYLCHILLNKTPVFSTLRVKFELKTVK